MNYLLGCLRKVRFNSFVIIVLSCICIYQDREKSSALQAVGIMALAVRDKVFSYIDPILNVIKSSLPSSREIASKCVNVENFMKIICYY